MLFAEDRGHRNNTAGRSFRDPSLTVENDDVMCGRFSPRHSSTQQQQPPTGSNYIPKPDRSIDSLYTDLISSGINFSKYDAVECRVTGQEIPPPIATFEDSNLHPTLLNQIVRLSHFSKPTPVQKHSLPVVMNGRDVMACAQTGSGKTAAYLLPIVHLMLTQREKRRDISNRGGNIIGFSGSNSPSTLIVAPTRELAIQIKDECLKVCDGTGFKSKVIYGGTSVKGQVMNILSANGVDILIATPGRLNHFVMSGYLSLINIQFLVLDEADRMLDMGFLPDIQALLRHADMPIRGRRQTLMFSATFPEGVQRVAREFLHESYIFITVGITGGACSDVTQTLYQLNQVEKREMLVKILRQEESDDVNAVRRILIFVEKKLNADFLAAFLCQLGFPTTSIHGDRLQPEREEALDDFRSGRKKILVATSVVARGINIKDITHVINYDLPEEIEDYVHRIGRTGRIGNLGRSTSFFDSGRDLALVGSLVRILADANQIIPEWLRKMNSLGPSPLYTSSTRDGRQFRQQRGGLFDYEHSRARQYGRAPSTFDKMSYLPSPTSPETVVTSHTTNGSSPRTVTESSAAASAIPSMTTTSSGDGVSLVNEIFGGLDIREKLASNWNRSSSTAAPKGGGGGGGAPRHKDELWDD